MGIVIAYRFVPLDASGSPRSSSQYRVTVDSRLRPGEYVDLNMLGHRTWEVLEVRPEAEGLISSRDPDGREIPVAGTIICRKQT